MNFSLNIVFLIGSAELQDGERSYQKTIINYRRLCGDRFDSIPVAYVKLPENRQELLPNVIDFLLDNDVKPIVELERFEARIFPQEERTKDILKLFSQPEVASNFLTLFVSNGWRINTDRFAEWLITASDVLSNNKDVLSIAFEGAEAQGRQISRAFIIMPSFTSRPVIVRTRDLMLAAKFAVDNVKQFGSISSEQIISHTFSTFSYHPLKFIAFHPQLAYSI